MRLMLILVLSAAGASMSAAAEEAASGAPDPLFSSHEVLHVTLNAPLRKLAKDRDEEPEYRPATFSYNDESGKLNEFQIKIRPRGHSRREKGVCTFPPLRLNFKKKEVKDSLFVEQNILKLVTHCRAQEGFQNYLLREYLVYRILNELTDTSFRVRLLKVTYHDSDTGKKPFERWGFLIEHKSRLADRLAMEVSEIDKISPVQLASEPAALAELFQYLVGNTDYSFISAPPGDSCCHNGILLGSADQYVPVPYDFDRTGMVNPPNGLPAEELGQRGFKDRLYRGFCRDDNYTDAAIRLTVDAQPRLESLIADQEGLDRSHKTKMSRFLDGFYKVIGDARWRERELKCRPVPKSASR